VCRELVRQVENDTVDIAIFFSAAGPRAEAGRAIQPPQALAILALTAFAARVMSAATASGFET
jgi:hypothetical protein